MCHQVNINSKNRVYKQKHKQVTKGLYLLFYSITLRTLSLSSLETNITRAIIQCEGKKHDTGHKYMYLLISFKVKTVSPSQKITLTPCCADMYFKELLFPCNLADFFYPDFWTYNTALGLTLVQQQCIIMVYSPLRFSV